MVTRNEVRPGLAYLERKEIERIERSRKKKLRSYKAEERSFEAIVRQLNKCCSKFGKKKPIKNGCKNCPDLGPCIRLFEERCEIKS